LTFMDSSPLITLDHPLSKLTHLTISSCTLNDLRIIFNWLPILLYLRISLPYNDHRLMFDYVPPHLTCLIINSSVWMLFNELEAFFSRTPLLERLELETLGEQDLLDGRRWQALIISKLPRLTKFALKISPEENTLSGDDVLIPFRNEFWTIEKRWYIACLISANTQSCALLFSVPHFSPSEVWYPPSEGFYNCSITPYSFNDSCTELRVAHFPSAVLTQSPFEHVQTLSLECSKIDIDHLQKVINLSLVHHLKIQYVGRDQPLYDLLDAAPHVYQLTMNPKTSRQAMDCLPNEHDVYQHIKILSLSEVLANIDIDRLCHIFSKVEHITLFIKDRDVILRILNGFEHLISATFKYTRTHKRPSLVSDEWLQMNNICIDGGYRLSETLLHVWID
jgi:hypothetical protein